MKSKFDISLIETDVKDKNLSKKEIDQFITETLIPILGPIKSFTMETLETGEKVISKEINIDFNSIYDNFTCSFEKNNIFNFGLNSKKNILYFTIFVEDSHMLLTKDIARISEYCAEAFPNLFTFYARNREHNIQVFKTLLEICDDYDPRFSLLVGDLSWTTVYSKQSRRGLKYILLPDEFYLNIPAYKRERLANGNIYIQLYEDADSSVEVAASATKKVIDYYKSELERLGIWKKVIWSPDWREKYKELLTQKGLL